MGLRQAEGGIRSVAKSCFDKRINKVDRFKPIFWYKQEDKEVYKTLFGLRYSDCYEVWGFKRTGCVGCPFNPRHEEDAKIAEQYEPKLNQASRAVFSKSYEYTRAYREFRKHLHD